MTSQLTLIDRPRTRRLDERTRIVGREGLAQARAVLAAARLAAATGEPVEQPAVVHHGHSHAA
jgi:hypothetical protein